MTGNPLAKKLKLMQDEKNLIMNASDSFRALMNDIPHDVTPKHHDYEFVMIFIRSKEEVFNYAPVVMQSLKEDAKLWFCYPKKTSGIKTDINRDEGWELVWQKGFGAVASVSVDNTWSALRFRQESRIKRKGTVVKRGKLS